MAIYQYDDQRPNVDAGTHVHEQAMIGQVTLAPGASIWPQALLRADNEPIHIGKGKRVPDQTETDRLKPLTVVRCQTRHSV
jgi:carbonic anhydrase/acetyltransferase-like protein (isoleucine patch superfamily)